MAEKIKIKLDVPDVPISMYPPDEFVADKDKDNNYFKNYARWLTTYYNPPPYSFAYNQGGGAPDALGASNDPSNFAMNISDDMLNNFAYLMGKQPNIDYRYLTMDATMKTFQAVWTKGRTAGMIVDFANGSFLESLDDMFFDAKSYSKQVSDEKKALFEKIRFAHELRGQLPEGVTFQPYNKEFDMDEDIDEEEKVYREALEEAGIDYAGEIFQREGMKFTFSKGFLHCLCGLAAIYVYVENGKSKARLIPCWNVIWDNRNECDDFGNKMRFWGFVEYITPAQAVSQNPELADIPGAVNELRAVSSNWADNFSNYMSYWNNSTCYPNNWQWWFNLNGVNMVSCATLFWIAPEDLQFKKTTRSGIGLTQDDQGMYYNDEKGNRVDYKGKVYVKERTEDEKGDYLTFTIHKAKLIGNKWCVSTGYLNNQVRDFMNPSNPMPNLRVFIPNQVMGTPRPIMSMLKPRQNKIDLYEFNITKLVGRDYGKIGVVNASVMGESGYSAIQFADELKNVGILVAKTNRDFLQLTRDLKAMEVFDFSNNQYITNYLQLKQAEKIEMMQIVGQSEVAMAQQKNYISEGAQNTTMAVSGNVMNYIFSGYYKYMEETMQYMVNVQKMLDFSGKNKDQFVNLSKIKDLKKRTFESLGVYIRIKDKADAKVQAYIISLAQAWSQNPQMSLVEPDDMLMLLKEKSIDVMISKLSIAIKKKKMEQQQNQKYQEMIKTLQQQLQQSQAEAHQASMQAKDSEASHKQKMDEILLKGSLDIKGKEVSAKHDHIARVEDAVIEKAFADDVQPQQSPPQGQPQQQPQGQPTQVAIPTLSPPTQEAQG